MTTGAGGARVSRIALIVPANNTTMAREVTALAPPGTALEVVRVQRGRGLLTRADISAYKERAGAAVAAYAGAPVDLALYGCTAAGFLAGPEQDAGFAGELGELLHAPVVSTAGAMVQVLQREGVRRVAVVSPYSDEVNAALADFLRDGGFEVPHLLSLAAPDVEALGRITPGQVQERAQTLDSDRMDALFIACSQLPTLEIVPELRQRLRCPVWTSILACTTLGLERLGLAAHTGA